MTLDATVASIQLRVPVEAASIFADTGRVTMPRALPDAIADEAHAALVGLPRPAWSATALDGRGAERVEHIDSEENDELIQAARATAHRGLIAGGFSYFFYRSNWQHSKACTCALCICRATLSSAQNVAEVSKITGRTVHDVKSAFWSRFSPGSFLSRHTDGDNGAVGFVYQLTRNWKPEYGGLLHFAPQDSVEVGSWIGNSFNSLLLFDVARAGGSPHFVSEVSRDVSPLRLAFTGWFR